jgi:hypothetical protein
MMTVSGSTRDRGSVLRVGHFSRALLDHSWQAPKYGLAMTHIAIQEALNGKVVERMKRSLMISARSFAIVSASAMNRRRKLFCTLFVPRACF